MLYSRSLLVNYFIYSIYAESERADMDELIYEAEIEQLQFFRETEVEKQRHQRCAYYICKYYSITRKELKGQVSQDSKLILTVKSPGPKTQDEMKQD